MADLKNKKTFKRTENKEYINKIISERLLLKPLVIQVPSINKKIAKIVKIVDSGIAVHFTNFIPPMGPIVLTGFINKLYAEIEVKVLKHLKESIFLCDTGFLRVSPQSRREVRFHIVNDKDVFIKRIKISRNILDLKGDTIPAEYKAVMDRFTVEKAGIADYVLISTLDKKSKIHQEVAKTGKTFFISDSRSLRSFEQSAEDNEDLINLKEFYGDSLQAEKTKMLNKNIIGRVVSPIFGPQSHDEWVPIGFIDIISKNKIDFLKIMEIKALSFEIVDSICEVNQIDVDEKQRVLEVSKSGIRVHIKNKDLINAMRHRPEFTFTMQVPGQAAINAVALIKKKNVLDDGSLVAGVKILGEKTKGDHMLRYYDFIKSLEEKAKQQ